MVSSAASPEVRLDLNALTHNIRALQNISSGLALFPVLKADAYGHGAQLIAHALEKQFTDFEIPYFCVARTREACELRAAGIKRSLLILSQFSAADFADFPKDTALSLNSEKDVEALLAAPASFHKRLQSVHLNFNTGMNRLGFQKPCAKDLPSVVERLVQKGIKVSGLMSHLARAEEDPKILSQVQVDRFEHSIAHLRTQWRPAWGPFPQWIHVSNSCGLVRKLGSAGLITAARPGLHVWGAFQDTQLKEESSPVGQMMGLKPVMQVRAPLLQIFWAEAGEGVGYGHRFVCDRKTLLGTVSLGYADGIDRSFSRACGEAWSIGFVIGGVRVPIAGTVSMDMTVVDLTDHPQAEGLQKMSQQGEVLWAYWICLQQSAEAVAQAAHKISYEIFCSLGHRLPRVAYETEGAKDVS